MSNQPEERARPAAIPDREAALSRRIDDYLDFLCAPLVGIMDYEDRRSFREEAWAHLQALVAEYRQLNLSEMEAVETALREFGDPWKVGKAFAREWMTKQPPPESIRRAQSPAACAFAWFGMASVVNLLIFERYALLPSFWYDPKVAQMLSWIAGLSPIAAGILTGLSMTGTNAKPILRVQAGLALFSLLFGLTFLPHVDMLILALCQIAWWLPAGYFTTAATATVAQRFRRPRFWRHGRRRAIA